MNNLNIVIPMAGAGARFADAGYRTIKPLLPVRDKPMIVAVVENIGLVAHNIFITQKEHDERYHISEILRSISPDATVLYTNGLTSGAAETVLLSEYFINNDDPLLIANSDQFIEYDSTKFLKFVEDSGSDACILTFHDTDEKWSFAQLGSDNWVVKVAEKQRLPNSLATCGLYYFKKGRFFVEAARKMIEARDTFRGEYYVCPAINYLIKNGGKVNTYNVEKMWGTGTPQDYEIYLAHLNSKAQ